MQEKRTKNLCSWSKWVDLPDELLIKISKCFKYSFEVGHFRAVCNSWRSAVPPPNHKVLTISNYIERPADDNNNNNNNNLRRKYIERSVFLLSSSLVSYLISVEEVRGTIRNRLLNPITGHPISSNFQIHLNNFRVIRLHKSLLARYGTTHESKVAYVSSGGQKVLAVLRKSGKLRLSRHKGEKVCLKDLMERTYRIHNLETPVVYHDVVKYNEKLLCAVDQYGRAVFIDPCLNLSIVTNPLFFTNPNSCYRKLHLVKSSSHNEELYLVDKSNYNVEKDSETPVYDTGVRFRVYKLDQEAHCWKEVTSLNDQIMFLGDDASFWSYCVSAKDFPGCRGNLIFFTDEFRGGERRMEILMILVMS